MLIESAAAKLHHRFLGILGTVLTAVMALGAGCVMQPPVEDPDGLAPQQRRFAFQSLCAQNAVECTSAWPVPVVEIQAAANQTLIQTDTGFQVEGPLTRGALEIQFTGSGSGAGNGAAEIRFVWTSGATNDDPCFLNFEPGEPFSTEADPTIALQEGIHYIRLTVTNNIIQEELMIEGCGVVQDAPTSDFLEVEVEIVGG